MSDAMSADEILLLANLPGSNPFGKGKKGPRRVATPQGAAYYGQPIGTIITADMIEAKRKENKAKGVQPAKGMLTSGSGNSSSSSAPSAANPSGGGQVGGQGGQGGKSSAYPSGGNVHVQKGYAAPGIDSTPPDWMQAEKPQPKLVHGVKPSSIKGPKKFSVGEADYTAPEGSRLIRPKSGVSLAFVITPDKKLHVFGETGEVEADDLIRKTLLNRFGDKVDKKDTLYVEEEFDGATPLEKFKPGQKLYDADGNDIFTKSESGWQHTALGVPVSDEDIKPLYESGELTSKKEIDEEEIDSFDWGDDDDVEIAFSEMSNEEFVEFLDTMDEGDHLYYVTQAGVDADGNEVSEYVDLTKGAGGWTNQEGHEVKPDSLKYLKNHLRTIQPQGMDVYGTNKKSQDEAALKAEQESVQKLKDQAEKDSIQAATATAAAATSPEEKEAAKQKANQEKARVAAEKAEASKKAYEDASGVTELKEAEAVAEKAAARELEKQQIEKNADTAIYESETDLEPGDKVTEKFLLDSPKWTVIKKGSFSYFKGEGSDENGDSWYPVEAPTSPIMSPLENLKNTEVVSIGNDDDNPKIGQKVTEDVADQLYDKALSGSRIAIISKESGHVMGFIDLNSSGEWISTTTAFPDSFTIPHGEQKNDVFGDIEFYIVDLNLVEADDDDEGPLQPGDAPDQKWLELADTGAAVVHPKTENVYVKKENGLWGLPGQDGINNPQQLMELDLAILPDDDWETSPVDPEKDPTGQTPFQAGTVVTPELYLAVPDGTPFKYHKLDGTTSDYVKYDDTTVLMPGGVFQPIHHWQKTLDKEKVTLAEDTVLSKPLDGTTVFEKPENWTAPIVNSVPDLDVEPTGDPVEDKQKFDTHVAELNQWEKDLSPSAPEGGLEQSQSVSESSAEGKIDTPADWWQALVDGNLKIGVHYESASDDEINSPGDGDEIAVRYNAGSGWFSVTYDENTGLWLDETGADHDPEDLLSAHYAYKVPFKYTVLGFYNGSHTHSDPLNDEDSVQAAVEDLQSSFPLPLSGNTLQVTKEEIYEAIHALETHPHGSPVYGLKSVSSDNFMHESQSQKEVIDHAKSIFPKMSPKQAVVKFLKNQIEPSTDETDLEHAAGNPTIHLGKDIPTKNAFGVTGGDFHQSDIEKAIDTLEAYDGKAFKAALNNQGNPLGVLDFHSLVGKEKDKLVQKKKVIDFLKKQIADLNPVEVKTLSDITGVQPITAKGDLQTKEALDALDIGAEIYTKTDLKGIHLDDYVKVGPDLYHHKNKKHLNGEPFSHSAETLLKTTAKSPYHSPGSIYLKKEKKVLSQADAQTIKDYPTGTEVSVYSPLTNSTMPLTKVGPNQWKSDNGTIFGEGLLIKAAAAGELNVLHLPTHKSHNDSDPKLIESLDELNGYGIGTVVSAHGDDPDVVPSMFQKVGHDEWDADGLILHSDELESYALSGSLYLESEPKNIPDAYVAPPAKQSKHAEGNGLADGHIPGVYHPDESNELAVSTLGLGAYIHVHEDGSGVGVSTKWSGKVPLSKEKVDKLLSAGKWHYSKPTSSNASSPIPQPAAKVKKPTVKFDPKSVPDGTYYLGDASNPDTPVWKVSGGVATLYNGDGSTETLSSTKLKNAVLKGTLRDKFGTTKVVPEGHTGTVYLWNRPVPAQTLRQLRLYAKSDQFTTSPADVGYIASMGVYIHAADWKNYADIHGMTPHDALLSSIDGMLGDPDDYPEVDLDEVATGYFEWVPGTKTAVPSPEIAKIDGPIFSLSATQAKATIEKISASFGDGKVIGQHTTGLSKFDKHQWLSAYAAGDFAKMYALEVKGATKQGKSHASGWKHPGYVDNTSTNHVKWAPASPGELPAGVDVPGEEWPSVDMDLQSVPLPIINNYLLAAGMAYPEYLSVSERRQWYGRHRYGLQIEVDKLSMRALSRKESGAAPLSSGINWTEMDGSVPYSTYEEYFADTKYPTSWGLTPAADWFDAFKEGKVSVEDPDGNKLSYSDLEPFFQANGSSAPNIYKRQAVVSFFQDLVAKQAAFDAKPQYKLAPQQTVKQSLHPIWNVTDQFGNKYLFKPAPSDAYTTAEYRANVEAAANKLSALFGGNAPKVEVTEFNGKLGVMQEELPAVGSLNGFDWSSITSTQAADLAGEHIIDWMLDQDDNWGPNTLILHDGRLAGVDKGRSFINYGSWNGFVDHAGMDVNTHLVYSDFYQSIIKGKISKEVADAAYLAARARAAHISSLSQESILPLLHEATDHRSSWKVAYKIDGIQVSQSQNGFFTAFFDRRDNLTAQVDELWKGVYAKAGLGDLPEPPKTYLGEGIHSGFDDPAYHEAVVTLGSLGTSILVSSPAVKDGFVTSWQVQEADGTKSAFSQIRLGPVAQDDVTNWFVANSDTSLSGVKLDATGFNYDDKYHTFLSAAKTVSHHAADGQYNQKTLDQLHTEFSKITKDLDFWTPDLAPGDDGFVTFPSGKKVAFGHVDQYRLMLQHYHDYYGNITSALENKTTVSPALTQFAATPLHPQGAVYFDGKGRKLSQLAGGKWSYADSENISIIDDDQAKSLVATGEWNKYQATDHPEKPSFAASINSLTYEQGGKFDPSTHTVKLTGEHISYGAAGKEFEVTLPTGERIFYRNAEKTNTYSSWQHGSLTLKVPNATTAQEHAQGLERARQWVKTNLGISLDGATPDDAELTYWNQMLPVLNDRKHIAGTPWHAASLELNKKMDSLGANKHNFPELFAKSASTQEQNEYYRDLWSKHFGADRVENFFAQGKHLPRFEKFNYEHLDKSQGRPIWTRLDVDLQALKTHDHMLGAKVMSSTGSLDIVKSGGMLSAEQRLRVLGDMMGSDDQGSGGSNSVFTRVYSTGKTSGIHFIIHPRAFLRTDARSFPGDAFGNPNKNTEIYSDPTVSWLKNVTNVVGKSGPETDLDGHVSLFGDLEIVVFDNASHLNEALQHLKKLGIEQIRGVPIEDRLVLRQNLAKAIQKIKKDWYAE